MHKVIFHSSIIKWLAFSVGLAILDQGIKWFALNYLTLREPVFVFKGLVFYLVYNSGLAFGWLNHLNSLSIIGIGLLGLFTAFDFHLRSNSHHSLLSSLGFFCMMGGGIGNFYDRCVRGVVVDFISFQILDWHTPIFNFADICISIGGLFILLSFYFTSHSS